MKRFVIPAIFIVDVPDEIVDAEKHADQIGCMLQSAANCVLPPSKRAYCMLDEKEDTFQIHCPSEETELVGSLTDAKCLRVK